MIDKADFAQSDLQRCQTLAQMMAEEIQLTGAMSFSRFMELALYAPGLGYYMAEKAIFGRKGDFITAPEISLLFSYCLAAQIEQMQQQLKNQVVVELGAGSGTMAADILYYLGKHNALPERYLIVETSPQLRKLQQARLQKICPEFYPSIEWREQIDFQIERAVIIANEFLDALPCHRFYYDGKFNELRVGLQNKAFVWQKSAIKKPALLNELQKIDFKLPEDFSSEINLNYAPLLIRLSHAMKKGVILFIDYGYPRREYYHEQRAHGTLKTFSRHKTSDQPLAYPGLCDITSHVDFTFLAQLAVEAGFELNGFTSQAHFLINAGLDSVLLELPEEKRMAETLAAKTLVMPQEMGEIIKVIGFSKNYHQPLEGFSRFDLTGKL